MRSDDNDEAPSGKRVWRLAGLAGLLAVPLALVWWPGCRTRPAVTSRESLELVKLVYTACNTKDPARLSRAEGELEGLVRAGKVSAAEESSFRGILADARAGDWGRAERAALKFAQDQVGRGTGPAAASEQPAKRRP